MTERKPTFAEFMADNPTVKAIAQEQAGSDAPAPGVRQYVGARYVPLIIGEWTDTREYEALSVVTYQGNSYTSRTIVPTGIPINDTDYWALTGNYNAQVEAYRQEVQHIQTGLSDLETKVNDLDQEITGEVAAIQGDVAKNTQEIADLKQHKQGHMVIFGDSYSVYDPQWSLGEWWQEVSEGLKLEPHNYAVIGAGLLYSANLLSSQVTTATADTSYNHEDVERVFIMSGCNDYLRLSTMTSQQVNTAATELIEAINATYPNARIVWIQNGWPASPWSTGPGNLQNKDFLTVYYEGLQLAANNSSFVVLNLSQILRLSSAYVHNEHPSASGAQQIAKAVTCWLAEGSTKNAIINGSKISGIFVDWLSIGNRWTSLKDEAIYYDGVYIELVRGSASNEIPAKTANTVKMKNNLTWIIAGLDTPITNGSTLQYVGTWNSEPSLGNINYNFWVDIPANQTIYAQMEIKPWGLGL